MLHPYFEAFRMAQRAADNAGERRYVVRDSDGFHVLTPLEYQQQLKYQPPAWLQGCVMPEVRAEE